MRFATLALLLAVACGVPAAELQPLGVAAEPLTACPAEGETVVALQARFGRPAETCLYLSAEYAQWPDDRTVVRWHTAGALVWPEASCGGRKAKLCAWLREDAPVVALGEVPCELPPSTFCQAYTAAP